jgi:predicted transcriptional regulator
MTVKDQLHKIVDELPEKDALEEMQYRLYVMRKVERGLRSIEEGHGIDHDQVVERMKKWQQE